jgi:hypothetical protein
MEQIKGKDESVVAATKEMVCETQDSVEISGYARSRSGVCAGVLLCTSPYSPSMLTIARV